MRLKSFKDIRNVMKKSMLDFCRLIYDPRANTILGRTPTDFFATCLFFILFYGFVLAIAAAISITYTFLSVKSTLNYLPINTDILARNLGLVSQTNRYTIKAYDINLPATYKEYIDEITVNLHEYYEIVRQSAVKAEVGADYVFDQNMLNPCNLGSYGFDTYEPCFFIRMSKILHYVPKIAGEENPINIPISCTSNVTSTLITILPSEGFPARAFPVKRSGLPPLVAIKISQISESVKINCSIKVEGLGSGHTKHMTPGSVHLEIEHKNP